MVIFDDPCHDGEGPATLSYLLIVWEEGAPRSWEVAVLADGLRDEARFGLTVTATSLIQIMAATEDGEIKVERAGVPWSPRARRH